MISFRKRYCVSKSPNNSHTMSTQDFKNFKQPFKVIEIPLHKFTEEVVPHHQQAFDEHKTRCQKLIALGNLVQLSREVKDKERTMRQLKDLMYELDTLRAQVMDCDLDRFDTKTLSLRKIILTLLNGYKGLKETSQKLSIERKENERTDDEILNPLAGASQIVIQEDLDDIKLKQQIDCQARIEAIEDDITGLHEIYTHINEMVDHQGKDVDLIEESVQSSNTNVQSGLRHLIKANKLKVSAYSMTGAFLGTVIGGPIGFVAGFKVGGLAALGCAIAGYTGGKYLKKVKEGELDSDEQAVAGMSTTEKPLGEVTPEPVLDKKII